MRANKKGEMRIDKRDLTLRAMAISNWIKDEKTNKVYSIQFYDYDNDGVLSKAKLSRILEIFPYDCITYHTKHGIHFISFSLLHGLRITKARAVETSKRLGNQDYWTEARDLALRVSPKWTKKKYRIVSEKPEFWTVINKPNGYIISKKHLEFYRLFMGLPKKVYELYDNCDKRDYKIKLHHYLTRD